MARFPLLALGLFAVLALPAPRAAHAVCESNYKAADLVALLDRLAALGEFRGSQRNWRFENGAVKETVLGGGYAFFKEGAGWDLSVGLCTETYCLDGMNRYWLETGCLFDAAGLVTVLSASSTQVSYLSSWGDPPERFTSVIELRLEGSRFSSRSNTYDPGGWVGASAFEGSAAR
jgi:hypothetical protein